MLVIGCCPFIEIPRKLAKSYDKNGFLNRSSGCGNGWNDGGIYAPDRGGTPGCGGMIGAECGVKSVGCVGAPFNGLNSAGRFGGKTVDGTGPDNVGETTTTTEKIQRLINYLFLESIILSKFDIFDAHKKLILFTLCALFNYLSLCCISLLVFFFLQWMRTEV